MLGSDTKNQIQCYWDFIREHANTCNSNINYVVDGERLEEIIHHIMYLFFILHIVECSDPWSLRVWCETRNWCLIKSE